MAQEHTVSFPETYYRRLREVAESYLQHDDPIRQCGSGNDYESWRQKREPILDAVESDGDFLDVGCANGYLLECLMEWGLERGVKLEPYGLDLFPGLIDLAKKRLPQFADHFYTGDIWDWVPPKRFRYVCGFLPVEYPSLTLEFHPHRKVIFHRLVSHVVEPGGRLILRRYYNGDEDRKRSFNVINFLQSEGFEPVGCVEFASGIYTWIDC